MFPRVQLIFKAIWLHLAGDKIDLKEGPRPYLETTVSDHWKWANKQPHCKCKTPLARNLNHILFTILYYYHHYYYWGGGHISWTVFFSKLNTKLNLASCFLCFKAVCVNETQVHSCNKLLLLLMADPECPSFPYFWYSEHFLQVCDMTLHFKSAYQNLH